ncbi:MAG: formate dehydrogenase subunit delta [Ancalomicrobiaceae bacterium]|nr:formate dehydrogenase subunit delta [Ancalomicrobiaceae bacterium]
MANQIGAFFDSQPEAQRVAGIAEHIARFWDRRMRRQIYAVLDAGGAGLKPDVAEALRGLRARDQIG